MPAPRGGRRPGSGKPPGGSKRTGTGRARPAPPGPALTGPTVPFERPPRRPDLLSPRVESPAGLRNELIELRAEVRRLAAEIDKLWARERGRSATTGRTVRSIAGKPARPGAGPRGARTAGAPAGGRQAAGRSGPTRTGGRATGGIKRTGGAKRGSGWAKPKTRSRRSGTTPRRQGR